MNRIPKSARIALLFMGSFMVFFYFSFPYGVLKELISTEIVNMTGFSVRMEELSPRIPFGISAKTVTLTPPGSTKSVEIEKVSVSVSMLGLLVGNLSLGATIQSKQKGVLDLDVKLPLFGLISGKDVVPRYFALDAENFALDALTSFALNTLAESPDVGPLLQPVLKGIGFTAKLSGEAKIDIDTANPQSSKGMINIALKDAMLKLSDPSLGLPDQKFNTAKVSATLEGGVLKVDPTSKLAADELSLGISGKVTLKKPIPGSELDLQIPMKVSGSLKDKFGFIIDAMSGGTPRNGELTIDYKGTLGNPTHTLTGGSGQIM